MARETPGTAGAESAGGVGGWRLSRAIRLGLGVLLLLTVLSSALLAGLTTLLHSVSRDLAVTIEGAGLANELQFGLLAFERAAAMADDPDGARASPLPPLESTLRRRLAEASRHPGSPEEAERLREAERSIEAYLAAVRTAQARSGAPASPGEAVEPRREAAFRAVDALVDAHIARSRRGVARAERIDRFANAAGVAVIALVVATTFGLVLAFHFGVALPLSRLYGGIARYQGGEAGARAPIEGPHELRVLAQEFNALADSAQSRERDQLAFLGSVAHDLRNPLAAINYSLELLKRMDSGRDLPGLDDGLARIGRQAQRLGRMVGDFLDATLVQAGRLDLFVEPVDVGGLLREAVEACRQATPDRVFRLDLPDGVPVVPCDRTRIGQVAHNLLGNAAKYSPAGSVVRVGLEVFPAEVVISVRDEGIGIAPDDLPRIFEPFRRRGTSHATLPGIGLGLFVSRRIVEAHGGRVEVQSAPGQGSTFRVHLPREPAVGDGLETAGAGAAPPTPPP